VVWATNIDDLSATDGVFVQHKYLAKHHLNIEDNIETFKNFGGYCDCEILWNVYDRREKAFPKGVLLN
jgi:hypothetical protein